MLRPVPIGWVKGDLHAYFVSNRYAGCAASYSIQIQIEAAIASWHHVGTQRFGGLAVDLHQDRQWFPPAGLQSIRVDRIDDDERIDAANFDDVMEDYCLHNCQFRHLHRTEAPSIVTCVLIETQRPIINKAISTPALRAKNSVC
jgi:hypothetical protein